MYNLVYRKWSGVILCLKRCLWVRMAHTYTCTRIHTKLHTHICYIHVYIQTDIRVYPCFVCSLALSAPVCLSVCLSASLSLSIMEPTPNPIFAMLRQMQGSSRGIAPYSTMGALTDTYPLSVWAHRPNTYQHRLYGSDKTTLWPSGATKLVIITPRQCSTSELITGPGG